MPHDSWAQFYDAVYEETFGPLYRRFTDQTVALVEETAPPPRRLLDLGAGTGRLAVPLARKGYHVHAVEPCLEMLAVLEGKAEDILIETTHSTIASFQGYGQFDLALCVFSVLSYITDEAELEQSFAAISQALAPGALILIDVPGPMLFQGIVSRTNKLHREVRIHPLSGDIFAFEEQTTLHRPEGVVSYCEAFNIRQWKTEEVLGAAGRNGLALSADFSQDFASTGASYLLLAKTCFPRRS
jgi:SAM-dependent methyltransferase